MKGAAKPEHFFSLATTKIRAQVEPSSKRGTNVSGSAKPYIFADIIAFQRIILLLWQSK